MKPWRLPVCLLLALLVPGVLGCSGSEDDEQARWLGLLAAGAVIHALQESEPELWLRFAHISDAHIGDEESPARTVRLDPLIPESWRPHEAYAAQVLDATLAVLNDHHARKPLDFVVHTGDAIELGQYNELRWFIDVFDGQWVVPDSGELDGVERAVAPELNPKLGFQAEGLDRAIPWYSVYGNHDGLCVGNFRIRDGDPDPARWISPLIPTVARIIGLHAFEDRPNALWPADDRSPAVILGREEPPMDPDTLQLRVGELRAGPIVPDSARQFAGRHGFIEEHFHTVTEPVGHGFTESNRREGHAYYSARPSGDAPIRLIVLDTVSSAPIPGFPFFYGVMTRDQFENFLKPEVKAARRAGEYVIIASHHPSIDFSIPHPGETVGTWEFRRFLASQPNVLAHICGHYHRNRVIMVKGRNPYPEIETASLIDYPQEGRIIEIYRYPRSGWFVVQSAMVSHMEAPTGLSAESFRRAAIDAQRSWMKASQESPSGGELPDAAAILAELDLPKELLSSLPEDPFAAAPAPQPVDVIKGAAADRDFRVELRR